MRSRDCGRAICKPSKLAWVHVPIKTNAEAKLAGITRGQGSLAVADPCRCFALGMVERHCTFFETFAASACSVGVAICDAIFILR